MIVPIEHLTLLTLRHSLQDTTNVLKELGVLQVQYAEHFESTFLTKEEETLNQIQTLFLNVPEKPSMLQGLHQKELRLLVSELYESLLSLKSKETEQESLQKELRRISPIGDFNLQHLIALRTQDVFIQIFQVPPKVTLPLWDHVSLFPIGKIGKNELIATVADTPLESDVLIEFELPEKSPQEIKSQLTQLNQEIKTLTQALHQEVDKYRKDFSIFHTNLEENIAFEKVQLSYKSLEQEEDIIYLQGYIPKNSRDNFIKKANEQNWGYHIRAVDENDTDIPTLIKNNKLVDLISPLFSFLDTYPGYKEVDLNAFILPFFVLFYAMLIGDAGYGAILTIVTLCLHKKLKNPAFGLLLTLALATTTWGILSGTYFGSIRLLEAIPSLQNLIIPPLASFGDSIYQNFDSYTIWRYCFIIGATQICLGYFIAFWKNIKTLSAFGHLAWLVFVIGAYQLVLQLVLGQKEIASYTLPLVISGYIGVALFDQQQKGQNFFKGLLKGLLWFPITFLDSISAFASIISYIRLYAVGLASVAIASSFNDMAIPLFDNPLTAIGGALILLLAHSLNLVMGLLAVIVHGVRLNMLEFAGSAGLEWSGIKYQPFQNTKLS